jgi:histone H3/H4
VSEILSSLTEDCAILAKSAGRVSSSSLDVIVWIKTLAWYDFDYEDPGMIIENTHK